MTPPSVRLPCFSAAPCFRRRGLLPALLLAGLASAFASAFASAGTVALDDADDASPASSASKRRVEQPKAVRVVRPEHPPELKQNLVNGDAVIEGLVDAQGRVQETTIISETHEGFGEAAAEALRQWEFEPGTVDGQPAPLRVRVPFEFRLSPDQVLSIVAGRPVYREVDETVIPASQLPSWPRPIKFYLPRYPKELEGTGKYGKAVVNITIDKEGQVINPKIVKATYPEFALPALITALQLRFPPQVMADRKTIYVNMDIQFDFKVPDRDKGR